MRNGLPTEKRCTKCVEHGESMKTLGELVDELSITNVKLFHVQELVFKAEREKSPLAAEHVARLVQLNARRTRLINEINGDVDPIVKITE